MRARRLAAVAMAGVLAACGGDSEPSGSPDPEPATTSDDTVAEETADVSESTAPVEALRVRFDSVHDGPFALYDLEGDLWMVESDFSAFVVDPAAPVSGCDSTKCLSSGSVEFGEVMIPVGPRLFASDEEFTPNQFVWIGSELDDGPHNVVDETIAPGDARGEFSEHIARIGDRVYAYDEQSSAVESVTASTPDIDTAPEIGTPIPVDPPFPDNTRLVADDDTLWLYSNQNSTLYPSGDTGPIPAAAVDPESGELGPMIDLVDDEYGSVALVVAAGGHLVVEGSDGDDSGAGEGFVTAFAPDGTETPLEIPDGGYLRNLTASGDRVFMVTGEDHRAFVGDPADGTVTPVDLGVDPDATVTAYHGDEDGVWVVADGRDLPTTYLRVDLAEGSVVERIDLTDELARPAGTGFVNGRPYFVLGDGTSDEWELVILGGEGIDLGYPTPAAGGDAETEDSEDGDPETGDPESVDPEDEDTETGDPETGDPGTETTVDPSIAKEAEEECPPGKSAMECYG